MAKEKTVEVDTESLELTHLKAENSVLRGLLKSAYGYVKAHEYDAPAKSLLIDIDQALMELASGR